MKTTEEIISMLESDLEEAHNRYIEWKDKDEREAIKHIVRMHTIENILDKIDPPEEVNILVTMPEKEKQKKGFLYRFVNIYSFLMFAASYLFIGKTLYAILDQIPFLRGLSDFLVFVLFCIHIFSYLTMLRFSHLTFKDDTK